MATKNTTTDAKAIETAVTKKATAVKAAAKKVTAKKATVKKAPAKKATAKKAAVKKVSVKKVSENIEAKVDDALESAESTLRSARRFNIAEKVSEVSDILNERAEDAQALVKQVWFAGLGAWGKSLEDVQDRYSKVNDDLQSKVTQINEDGQSFVKELVQRGEKVQDEAELRLKESRANIEEQIEVAKDRLTGLVSAVDIPARLQDVSDKLEALSKDLKKSA